MRQRITSTFVALVIPLMAAMVLLAAAACTTETTRLSATSSTSRVQVVTTTVILSDLVKNVGGDRVEVRSILPAGADIHSFQPGPQDSITISDAAVIISNGFGLDDMLGPTIKSAKRGDAVSVVATEGLEVKPLEVVEPDEEDNFLEDDPHFWQSPLYVLHYVERIRDALVQADPDNAQVYQANAASYIQKLQELDLEIVQALSVIPPPRRHLVTFHDAFGYFAARYGWKVSAFVAHDASDVTPGAVAGIMKQLQEEDIPAVFTGPQFNSDIITQAARDAGVRVGVIYSGTLDSTAPTYIDMLRFNAGSLVEHLR